MSIPVSLDFYNKTRGASKIIIVDLGFLGDSVHLIPALWEIQRHYPQAQIHTLSAPVGAEILRLAPCVERAWVFPLSSPSPPWWRHWDIIKSIRKENFDLAINFNAADRTIFLSWLANAKWSIAHDAGRKHFWNRWLIPDWVPLQSRKLLIYEQRRQVLAACGFSLEPARFDIQVPEEERRWAEQTTPAGAIHLSINASNWSKEWPVENWAGLAKKILETDPTARLLATSSPKEREQIRLRALAQRVSDGRLQCFEGLSVGRLAALLQRCKLQIGGDSGVTHLAMALQTPTFSLLRDYPDLAQWIPQGAKHRHLSVRCGCLTQERDECRHNGKAACLAEVSSERVFAELRGQLQVLPERLAEAG